MVKLFYDNSFNLERESITLRKYKLVKERLLNEGIVNSNDIKDVKPLTIDDLLLVHTKEYIDAVRTGKPSELAESNGIKWGRDVYERAIYSLGSVYQSLEDSLKNGISGSLSSGYHHAHRSHGKGFCTFNYIIPIKKLILEKKINNALILDCDVHHPDGTENCIGNDERIFSLSINGTSLFKNKDNKISYGIGLPDGIDYYKYESILECLLTEVINRKKPDIILYKASQDSHKLDIFGNLSFTAQNLFERDQFVIRYARLNGIPISFIIGSGYSRPIDITVNGHINTVKASLEVEEENPKNIDNFNTKLVEEIEKENLKQIEEGKIYFIDKLTDRLDRMSGRKMRAGKLFNLGMDSFYFKINDKWDYDNFQGIRCNISHLKLMGKEEFREASERHKLPKVLIEKILGLDEDDHFVNKENHFSCDIN